MYIRDRSHQAIINSKGDFLISLFYTLAQCTSEQKNKTYAICKNKNDKLNETKLLRQ